MQSINMLCEYLWYHTSMNELKLFEVLMLVTAMFLGAVFSLENYDLLVFEALVGFCCCFKPKQTKKPEQK